MLHLLSTLLLAPAAQTDLTFVRHGETIANATGRYSTATVDTFSKKGEVEVAELTKQLIKAKLFDAIYVSPSPRALRTIAPYLRATHEKAVIWPLLYECCTGRRPANARPTSFKYGSRIKVPNDIVNLFTFVAGDDRFPEASDYDAGLAQVDAAVASFRTRCAGVRVLLVGHSGMGGHFIHSLTGQWHKLENAKPLHLDLPERSR
jgi:broad specificity phosphatase PhoE